eukprot:s2238_g7.t1
MAEKRIGLQCLEISGSTAKMFEALEFVYNNKDEGLVMTMKVHSMTSDPESVLSTIVKASWNSVQESLTQISAALVTAQDTSGWKMFEATIESIEFDTAVKFDRVQDNSHRDFKIHEVTTNDWIAPKPFSQGAMRATFAVFNETSNERLVAKRYMNPGPRYNSREALLGDLRSRALSKSMTEKFNRRRPREAPLYFVQSSLMRITVEGTETLMTVEPFIAGEYRKESNNRSFAREGSDVAQAFTHFTHDVSGGDVMVVDIHGVREALTDPQVHSKRQIFGRGNMGPKAEAESLASMQHPTRELGLCSSLEHLLIYYIRKSAEAVLRERKQDPVWIAGVKFAWHPHRNVPVVLDSDPRFGPEPGWPHSLSGERNHLELGMASESCSGEAARLFARLLICRAVSYDSYVKYRIAELQVSAPSRVELSQCMQQARRCDAQAG